MIVACVDACCAFNLINGNALHLVAQLAELRLMVQGLVEDEMKADFNHIQCLATAGRVDLLSGDKVLASEVGSIADRYNLGLGESECIAIGCKFGVGVATDDKKARLAAIQELGSSNVIGSIGLLKLCVEAKIMTGSDAFETCAEMIKHGAFLPRVSVADFERR